ncbi:MAG: hypothetical protein GY847_10375 [Proteobacteria bacterium]|nr:hypothetical protein [Pseudomonadota bacterium]
MISLKRDTFVLQNILLALSAIAAVGCKTTADSQESIDQTVPETPQVAPQPVPPSSSVAHPRQVEPSHAPLPDLPAQPGVEIPQVQGTTPGDRRKKVWLEETFRCRAISTTRLRKCRFEKTESGNRLRFKKADITCKDAVFDENGDPIMLTGCRSNWLKIPAKNKLKSDRAKKLWSGSFKGWKWKSDKEKYCCPGIWLEAPAALQN